MAVLGGVAVVHALAVGTFTCDLCRGEIRRGEMYVRELHGLSPEEPLRRYRAHWSCWLTKQGASLAESVAKLYPELNGRTPEDAMGSSFEDADAAKWREAMQAFRRGEYQQVPDDPDLMVRLWDYITGHGLADRYREATEWLGRRLAEMRLIQRYTLEMADGTRVAVDETSGNRARRRAARWYRATHPGWRKSYVRRIVEVGPPKDPPLHRVEVLSASPS